MKFYIAEIVATGIAFLCALTNHAGACWVWKRLMPLDLWASNIMDERGVNQLHRFQTPPGVTVAKPSNCVCHHPLLVASSAGSAGAASWRYCPDHGMVRES